MSPKGKQVIVGLTVLVGVVCVVLALGRVNDKPQTDNSRRAAGGERIISDTPRPTASVDGYREPCFSGLGEQVIAACNILIASNQLSSFDLRRAYQARAAEYSNRRGYDQAILDYDRAISLSPNDAFAYHGRGRVYFQKGAYDRAIQGLRSGDQAKSQLRQRLLWTRAGAAGERQPSGCAG